MPSTPPAADSAAPDVAADPADLDFAVSLTRRAGELAAERFFAETAVTRKPDGSEVTAADIEVEEFFRAGLAERFPADAVLGEELGESGGGSGRRWVIDPISGTGYFVRRMPLFANLLAREDEHGTAIGVINQPIQGETVYAGRGLGCHRLTTPGDRRHRLRPEPVATDPADTLVLALNQQKLPTDVVTRLHAGVQLVGGIHHPVLHVLTGRAGAAVLAAQSYDDLAPLPVIVAEAGGRITDFGGGEVLAGDGSALVTGGGPLHEVLLELIGGLAGQPPVPVDRLGPGGEVVPAEFGIACSADRST